MLGLSFLLPVIIIFIICAVIASVMADYKIFQKAGEEGWKSLVPIYSEVIFCKCFMGKGEYAAIPMIASFFSRIASRSGSSASILFAFPFSIISIAFYVYQSIALAKSFGKSSSFTLGLIFIPFIFKLILAFSDDQYYGPKGVSMYSYNNNGYGDTSYISANGYQNNAYNINNAYQNTGYQSAGYNNSTGYQSTGYNNSTGYQSTGYNNNTGYQSAGYNNNTGYQNAGYNNNTGYQNTAYTNNNAYQNTNPLYSTSNYQNNNGVMDDIDTSDINIDDLK